MADEHAAGDRDRIYLKSGMGSVAAADYDEKIHGKALELDDDQYAARQRGIIPGVTHPMGVDLKSANLPVMPGKLTTTITGLQSLDPAAIPAPVATVTPPVATVDVASLGRPVQTTDSAAELKKAEDDKTSTDKPATARPSSASSSATRS